MLKDKACALELAKKKIRVIKINGAFFFGSSAAFENKANPILDVPFMDLMAIFTLRNLITKLKKMILKSLFWQKRMTKSNF